MSRPAPNILLTEVERAELTLKVGLANRNPKILRRLMIVLMSDEGKKSAEICANLGLSITTVNRWRRVFLRWRIPGLLKSRRPKSSTRT